MALLAAVLATSLLTGLALAIAFLGMGESMLASHDRTARSLRQASYAAVQLALADLRAAPAWSDVLTPGATAVISAAGGRFADGTLVPVSPWGGPAIDLRTMTEQLQAASDAARGPADPAQTWLLYEYGPLERAVPGASPGPLYVAVWVADDRADTDGDPSRDTNGILAIRAVALGPANALAATDVSLARIPGSGGADVVRLLTVRPGW
jgi:hypothetical protein